MSIQNSLPEMVEQAGLTGKLPEDSEQWILHLFHLSYLKRLLLESLATERPKTFHIEKQNT